MTTGSFLFFLPFFSRLSFLFFLSFFGSILPFKICVGPLSDPAWSRGQQVQIRSDGTRAKSYHEAALAFKLIKTSTDRSH